MFLPVYSYTVRPVIVNDKGEIQKAYIVHRSMDNSTAIGFRVLHVTFDVNEANKIIHIIQPLSIRLSSVDNLSKLEDMILETLFTEDD